MGLQQSVLQGVEAARTALGDLLITVPFTRRVKNAYVPGQPVGYTETVYQVDGAITQYDLKELKESVIESTDVKFIILKFEQMPIANDVCTINGINYRVMHSNPIMAGSVVAITITQLRPNGSSA